MVVITGAAIGAACPPAIALFGAGGGPVVAATMQGAAAAALPGITPGLATISALGEGAIVGAGVIGSGGSGSAGIALATMAGPVGWWVVGCNKNGDHNSDRGYTWDCWKPVVRDMSTQPSSGMTLRSLAAHPNVQSLSLDHDGLLVDNTFGERFRLTLVDVEGTPAFHASILSA